MCLMSTCAVRVSRPRPIRASRPLHRCFLAFLAGESIGLTGSKRSPAGGEKNVSDPYLIFNLLDTKGKPHRRLTNLTQPSQQCFHSS